MEHPEAYGTHAELMVGKANASQRRSQTTCEAVLEKWVENAYQQVWRKSLVNKFSPESALVSAADGSFVTFDEWGESGNGSNVIVIYDGSGELVRRLSLSDILSEEEMKNLPRTWSTMYWGGHHILTEGDSIIVLRVAANNELDQDKRKYRDLKLRMVDGSVVE